MTPQEQVKEFHQAFGHPVKTEPELVDGETAALRIDLITEELTELVRAVITSDLVEIADALADLTYVIYGAAHAYGIDLDKTITEVHRSNMSKLGADGKPIYREDGKILKGPHYSPPNIAETLGISNG